MECVCNHRILGLSRVQWRMGGKQRSWRLKRVWVQEADTELVLEEGLGTEVLPRSLHTAPGMLGTGTVGHSYQLTARGMEVDARGRSTVSVLKDVNYVRSGLRGSPPWATRICDWYIRKSGSCWYFPERGNHFIGCVTDIQ